MNTFAWLWGLTAVINVVCVALSTDATPQWMTTMNALCAATGGWLCRSEMAKVETP